MDSLKDLVNRGIESLNLGDLEDARSIFEKALRIDPQHADANHLIAIVLIRSNSDLDQAIQYINKALEASPGQIIFLNSLGTALWLQKEFLEASQIFERIVEQKPDYYEAQFNLANCYKSLERLDDAIAQYQTLVDIDPGFADAHNELGLLFSTKFEWHRAIEHFNQAIEVEPARFEFYVNLGHAMQCIGDLDEALVCIQNAISLSPNNGKLLNNLATIYLDQGNYNESKSAFAQALGLLNDDPIPLFNLGYLAHLDSQFQDAVNYFESALKTRPQWTSAWLNLANAHYKLGEYAKAISCYETAISNSPNNVVAHSNLAVTYRRLNRDQDAIPYLKHALELQPDHAKSHLALAMSYLRLGYLELAWRHYEWRFEATNSDVINQTTLKRPLWCGQSLSGKKLLLLAEQGAGDTLQFIRYAKLLTDTGARILFSCNDSLVRLIERMDIFESVDSRKTVAPGDYDYYLPLLSLPGIFNTDLSSIPRPGAYISADQRISDGWKERIGTDSIRVGLAWSGNPDQLENQYRSCRFSDLASLLEKPGFSFYSLQKGPTSHELEPYKRNGLIHDYTDEFEDFADTADFISALDLVITVDTSIAHLAGSMGKPVWTILWFSHCWRYLLDRSDSPWYPSMRLFRQSEENAWTEVVADVQKALNELPV